MTGPRAEASAPRIQGSGNSTASGNRQLRSKNPPHSLLSTTSLAISGPLDTDTVLHLQKTVGNRAVTALLVQRRAAPAAPAVHAGVTQKRGGAKSKAAKPAKKTAAPAPAKKPAYDETEPTIETPAAPVGGWTGATGINAGERQLLGIRRIPLQGIKSGYQEPDEAHRKAGVQDASRADTPESAEQEAIVLVPSDVGDDDKPVEVLLHLHGYGIGYRQQGTRPKGAAGWGPGEGKVRDVKIDMMERQIAESGRRIVGILPQGNLTSRFGEAFPVDDYVDQVFAKLTALKAWKMEPKRSGLILSGHSGAGLRISEMFGGPLEGTKAEQQKAPLAPQKLDLKELILFDAINNPSDLATITAWLLKKLDENRDAMKGKSATEREAFLKTSFRFRGYHTQIAGYKARYEALDASLAKWFKDKSNVKAVGGKPWATMLRSNYQVVPADKSETGYEAHEHVIGHGHRIAAALQALPPTEEQNAFLETVLKAAIAAKKKQYEDDKKELPRDLTKEELDPVADTKIPMRKDAAAKATDMLTAARTALKSERADAQKVVEAADAERQLKAKELAAAIAAAKASKNPEDLPGLQDQKNAKEALATAAEQAHKTAKSADVLHTAALGATSGYRAMAHQEELWRGYFFGHYYDTAKERANMKGGPHGPEAIAHMVWYVGQWVAPPGFSNHQNGKAIDLLQEREPGYPIRNSRDTKERQKWWNTWLWHWLDTNAKTFKFKNYEKEPWHWDFQSAG